MVSARSKRPAMRAIDGSLVAKELPERIARDVCIAFIAISSCVLICQAGAEMEVTSTGQNRSVNHIIVVSR